MIVTPESLESILEESRADIKAAIRRAVLANKITAVICGTSFKNKGVQPMLDAVVDYLPSPTDVPPIHGLLPDTDELVQISANWLFCAGGYYRYDQGFTPECPGRAHDPEMRDPEHRHRVRSGFGERRADPLGEHGDALPAMGAGAVEIFGPGVDLAAGQVVPPPAFPGAEIHLGDARIDPEAQPPGGGDALGEAPAAGAGARHDAGDPWQAGEKACRRRLEIRRQRQVAPAIAEAFAAERPRVAQEDQRHASTPR